MQSSYWSSLLKKLPAEFHNQLTVVTLGGTEIMVQTFMLVEGECLIIKGRLAACQDTGRLYFVPFDQIDYLGFNRAVGEEEFRSWFSEAPPPEVALATTPEQAAQPNGTPTKLPSRAALLERVRARTTSPGLNLTGISLPAPPPTST